MVNASHTDQTNPGELCFRKLIEHSYAGITLLDHELKVVYRSPSAERITGWSLANRTGQAVTSLVHPDDALVLHQILLRIYAQPREPVTTRFRTRHYAGHYITIDCTLTNLLDEPGVEAIVFNFVDVTRQVKLEAQQQQSRRAESEDSQTSAKLEAILGSITDGFFTADADQRYTYVNKRLCQMVGLAPDEMIGRQVWDVFPDAVGSTTYDSIQEALHEKHFVRSEDYYAPLDLWQENRVYPGADGFSMFIQDITNRKKADEQLRLLFDRAPDMIGILGLDRYFKRVNLAMCSQLEYTEKQLLDTSLDVLVHPDDVEVSRERTVAFIASDNRTLYFENRFLTKSGKTIWLSWTVTRSANEKWLFCVGKNTSDKKEIENLLHKANQLARIGSWEVDRVNGTAYWSPITREIYEVPESFEPSANNWLSFYRQGADRDYIAGKMANTIATGKPCDAEVELVTALGNLRWVRAMAEAEFMDGECVRVYGSFQDIDHRKRAELAATAALAERNAILESIGDGFFAVDRNWIVTYWNATAEKNTGKPRETVLGKYFWDIYKDMLDLEFYRSYQHAMREATAVHFEDYYPAMQAWFAVSAYPSENGLSVFFRDISESKRTMQALAESEKRYSDLFHLSPQPMFVYAMDTLKYLDVNEAAIAHYGYSHKEFLAMTILDIRPSEDIPLVQQTVDLHQYQEKVILHGIFRHRKKNGELINVDIQSNVITYQGIKAKVVLANDVTERLQYIKAIEAQNEKLREISWMQSHVIRAPLARIMALLPMLELPAEPDAEQKRIYDYLVASANELDQVIHSITDATCAINLK